MQPLSRKDYRPFKHFIFIDALPKLTHYQPYQAGYAYAKDRQSFVSKIAEQAQQKKFKFCKDEGNLLRFLGLNGLITISTQRSRTLSKTQLSLILFVTSSGFTLMDSGPGSLALIQSATCQKPFGNLALLGERTSTISKRRDPNHYRRLFIGEATLCDKGCEFEHCKRH